VIFALSPLGLSPTVGKLLPIVCYLEGTILLGLVKAWAPGF
jgi:hypothetical protein